MIGCDGDKSCRAGTIIRFSSESMDKQTKSIVAKLGAVRMMHIPEAGIRRMQSQQLEVDCLQYFIIFVHFNIGLGKQFSRFFNRN